MAWKCSVDGCSSTRKTTKMNAFRRDQKLLRKWLLAIHKPDLERDPNIFKKCVCDLHFSNDQKFTADRRNRTNLKYNAVPDTNLPGHSAIPCIDTAGTSEVGETHPVIMKNGDSSEFIRMNNSTILPSGEEREEIIDPPEHMKTAVENTSTSNVASGSSCDSLVDSKKKHNVGNAKTYKSKRINLLRSINATRRAVLTPRARKLYDVSIQLKKLGKKLLSKNKNFKHKLNNFEKTIDQFPAVNLYTQRFIASQQRLQQRHVKGRRFTVDDKILALSIYRRGPKTYRLLRKIFALPSRKTLMQLLQRVPFNVGMNKIIMKSLKTAIAKEKPLDRHCVVMFDEIFLEEGLCYNKTTDSIDSFIYDFSLL